MLVYLIFLFNTLLHTPTSDLISLAKSVEKKYNAPNKNYVVLIDYSKSISTERLFVVDMKKNKIVLKSKVSHSLKSGYDKPYNFSNSPNSKKTSLGLYLTKNDYYGKFGYSLRLRGLESSNSNAEYRAIVFHSDKEMHTKWSWGCFATSEDMNRKIISLIKGGVLVYVYN